jgi:hypothetical protein
MGSRQAWSCRRQPREPFGRPRHEIFEHFGRTVVKKWACLQAFAVVALSTFAWPHAAAADEFQNVKCGGDIPRAVIGRHSPNGTVMATEKKYRALRLKDLGGDEISDRLSTVNWLICGSEYIFLIDRGGTVQTAWKIDQSRGKFVKVVAEGMLCPRSGISTGDGGR